MSVYSTADSAYSSRKDQIISATQLFTSLEKLGPIDWRLRNRITQQWDIFASEIQRIQSAIQYELACTDGVSWFSSFSPWKFMYEKFGITPWLQGGLENRTALYKKRNDSNPFTYQAVNIDGEMHLFWHTNITFGRGAFKKGKAIIDMRTGTIFAQLITQKPHKITLPGRGVFYLFGTHRENRRALLSADAYIEARTYLALNHPHILNTVFHGHIVTKNLNSHVSGQEFQRREIIVEHCLGDFGSVLDKRNFTATEAVRIAAEYADGIRYMHQNGYFHLDLKPDNLLVNTEKRGKVADFGCSIHLPTTFLGQLDRKRLQTVLEERRLLPPLDLAQIKEACIKYEKQNTTEAFQRITTLLSKVDVWMFSSVLQDILDTYSYSIKNPSELRKLLDQMQQANITLRPMMEEVYIILKNMKIISIEHSCARTLDSAYEHCIII